MISRVADHCFWFGRYLDRAESTARLLQVTRTLVFDADLPVTQCWAPLVIVSGEQEQFDARHGADAMGNGEIVQHYMTWDPDNLASLRSSIRAARENARVIRDVLSSEVWEEVNELYLWLGREDTEREWRENREEFYKKVLRSTQLCMGLVRSTMLHDTPMSFLWLGVMLERVGQSARTLDMHHHTMEQERAREHAAAGHMNAASIQEADHIVETALWLSLLRACSGYEAFMKKSRGRVTASAVMSFLVFDDQFPRSLRYCLRAASRIIREIWPEPVIASRASAARLEGMQTWLHQQELRNGSMPIHSVLTHVVDETALACQAIQQEILGPRRAAEEASPSPLAQRQAQ